MKYSSITIIYNPNSTGPGKGMAEELKAELDKANLKAKILRTEHAGHAKKLAYDVAKASSNALVISASGDGGYHDVVNGLMEAQQEGSSPVAGLLPAGNANDHFESVHGMDVATAIIKSNEQKIDILELSWRAKGKQLKRYAHSYIGIGLTPKVGSELNKEQLNWLNEKWIVIKALFYLKPVQIKITGQTKAFYSLVFSNIERMSKVLNLSEKQKIDDRKFEITSFNAESKARLLAKLIKASTIGLEGKKQAQEFSFTTIYPTFVQLDGEVTTIDENTDVVVALSKMQLRCLN